MSSNLEYSKVAPGAVGVDPNHPARARFRIVDAEKGIIEPEDGIWRKKFAIVGFAASSRNLAPFDDPSYTIIGLNQLYRHIPRADVWYEIHHNWDDDAANVPGTDHRGYLAECGMPIFMTEVMPDLPTSVAYPVDDVMKNVVGIDYFTSTVAFMLAWAIRRIDEQVDCDIAEYTERVKAGEEPAMLPADFRSWVKARYAEREIAIFGIDLIVGTEYDWQKCCVEYILGLAEARGITLRLPPACALLKQRWRYGYQADVDNSLVKLAELERRIAAHVGRRNQLVAELQTIDGALQELQYWEQVASLRSRGGHVKLNEDP